MDLPGEHSPVGAPADPSLPFLAYGTFRPGELAHEQVKLDLRHEPDPVVVPHHVLRLRDGLPLLEEAAGSEVRGELLHLGPAGYAAVGEYEPRKLYRWATVQARSAAGPTHANALLGKSPSKGSEAEFLQEWRGALDPLFGPGLHALGEQAVQAVKHRHPPAPHEVNFWSRFILLQGTYLTAWTVAERLSAMAFGPRLDPTQKVTRLGTWEAAMAAVAAADPPPITVYDSRGLRARQGSAGGNFFTAWYGTRSNLSHRGKAAMTDYSLVQNSLIGLHDTLRVLLGERLPGLQDVWRQAGQSSGRPSRLPEPWLLRPMTRR